jgi:hypothetical protein
MIQEDQLKATAPVKTIPEAKPQRPRSTPWLVAGLAATTALCVILAGLILYPRLMPSDAERLAGDAIAAWDAGGATPLYDVYDRDAVVMAPDGTRLVGIDKIAAGAKALGPEFTVTATDGFTESVDGSLVTGAYRYAGSGKGAGISVFKVIDGQIVRQWNYGAWPTPEPK